MKKTLKKHWLVLLIVLLIAGWFYWFQFRPARIRSRCSKEVALMVSGSGGSPAYIQEKYNLFYEACLNRKGLK